MPTAYISAALLVAVALLEVLKDWHEWQHRWKYLPWCLLLLIVIAGAANIGASRQAERQDISNFGKITQLTQAVKSEQNNNQTNAQNAQNQIGALLQKVADLESDVKTEKLKTELESTRTQLLATQKTLNTPKATLAFTFWPFTNPPLGSNLPAVLSRDVTLPVDSDGNVHVDFAVINLSPVSAVDGDITLTICDVCKYVKEPEGFTKKPGLSDTERIRPFHHIDSQAYDGVLGIDFAVPTTLENVQLAITYRCTNCLVEKAPSTGLVRLQRTFRKTF